MKLLTSQATNTTGTQATLTISRGMGNDKRLVWAEGTWSGASVTPEIRSAEGTAWTTAENASGAVVFTSNKKKLLEVAATMEFRFGLASAGASTSITAGISN